MILDSDRLYLEAAVQLAERGLFSATPNPRVGCIVERRGVVLGRGWHVRAGEGHAEVNALADAGGSVAGATLFVSLEPCAFEGRTPPCTQLLIDAGVGRVVAAMTDPHPRVSGEGFAELARAGIEVDVLELPSAVALNAGYARRVTTGRPLVRVKVAASLDGRTAMDSGESRWVTGAAARADVQYWRARSCAIVTGSGTVLADDPQLNVREPAYAVADRLRQPLRVVADSRLATPPTAALISARGEVLLAHGAGAPAAERAYAPNVALLPCGAEQVDLGALLDALGQRGCNEVLVEAGPRLVGAFLEQGLWDELLLYTAPKLLGSTARPLAHLPLVLMEHAVTATIADCIRVGDDLRLRLTPSAGKVRSGHVSPVT